MANVDFKSGDPEEFDADFKSRTRGVGGFFAGPGGAMQFGKAFVDLRYTWGTLNILKDADGDRAKTRTFGLMAGFAF